MAVQEAKSIFTEQAFPSMRKAAEDAQSDDFFGELEKANTGLEIVTNYSAEGVLTEIAAMVLRTACSNPTSNVLRSHPR